MGMTRSHGEKRLLATWKRPSRGRTAPAPPVGTSRPGTASGPGPKLDTKQQQEPDDEWRMQNMKQNASLSSLAASSRLGVQVRATSYGPTKRPTTAETSMRPKS